MPDLRRSFHRGSRFFRLRVGYSIRVRPDSDTPAELAREAERGESERTPFLALTGVTLAVAALVGIVLVIVVAAYLIA